MAAGIAGISVDSQAGHLEGVHGEEAIVAERDLVLKWLRNAHAMEKGLEEALERHLEATEGYPGIQSRLRLHRDETRRHAQLMAECIEALGGEVSEVSKPSSNSWPRG